MIPQYEPVMVPVYEEAVRRQVASGWLGPGKATSQLEERFQLETWQNFGFATTSGTTALLLALHAVRREVEKLGVAFPAYTHIAGAHAASILGYKVHLVDIKKDTLCMSPEKFERLIEEKRIGVCIFVDHNGYVGEDRTKIKEICNKNNIFMIEDAAQGVGIYGAGAAGDIATFSFSVPKIITSGQGGMIVTSHQGFATDIACAIDQGANWRETRLHERLGLNFKFTDIQASLLLAQLDNFNAIASWRKRIWNRYSEQLNIYRYGQDFTWMVIYAAAHPEKVIEALRTAGYQATRYYKPIFFSASIGTDEMFPSAAFENAAWAGEHLLYLPSSHNLRNEQIDEICDVIKRTDV